MEKGHLRPIIIGGFSQRDTQTGGKAAGGVPFKFFSYLTEVKVTEIERKIGHLLHM